MRRGGRRREGWREAEGERKGEKGREGRGEEGATLLRRQACPGAWSSIGSFPRNFHLSGSQELMERRFGGCSSADWRSNRCRFDARVSSLPVHAKFNGLLVQYFRVFLDPDAVASFLDLPRDETDEDVHGCEVVIDGMHKEVIGTLAALSWLRRNASTVKQTDANINGTLPRAVS